MDPIIMKVPPYSSEPKTAVLGETKPPQTVQGEKKQDYDTQEKIDQVSRQIQEDLGLMDFKLNFSIDPATKTIVVKVINAETGKIIREIPSSELLALAKSMQELESLFFDENI